MTQLNERPKLFDEEDNGLSIADRTISLQYRQFRSDITAKCCILDNKKTCLLSHAEIQKYEKCLNGSLNERKEQLKLSDEIYVDIEGFSVEIAKKLGDNYLENKYVLVSTKQIECDSIRDSSYERTAKAVLNNYNKRQNAVLRKIFNIHRNTIEQILTGEALIGIVNQKDLSLIIDNPDSLFNIEIIFDTPNNAISKLKNIRKDERKLLEDSEKLKDRSFLRNLLQNIEDISTEHGSLDRIPDKEINLKEKVDFNKLHLNGIDIYCLKHEDGTNIFVYFDSTLQYRQLKPHNDKEENYMNNDLIILNGKDIESLNVLIELGMIGYNPYIGLERAANIILRNRKEKRENINGSEQKNIFDLDIDDNIPEKVKELLTTVELLVENKRNKDFFNNLGKIKIYMTYPLIQNEILYELLTRMEMCI